MVLEWCLSGLRCREGPTFEFAGDEIAKGGDSIR